MALAQAIFEECWSRWQQHFSPEVRLRLGAVELAALADCTPEMTSKYLSADELSRWTGFSQEKRRTEWLGGRLAAKCAVAGPLAEATVAWKTLVIRNEEDGRPYVATETHGAAFISISHSGHMAAALAANLPCGLDIQRPGTNILRVKTRFALRQEEAILAASLPKTFTETERLTMLWAAKEAARKMVRINPLLGLLELRLLAGHSGCGTPHEPLALTFTSGREQAGCPTRIAVLCFFADTLAWAMACPPMLTKE